MKRNVAIPNKTYPFTFWTYKFHFHENILQIYLSTKGHQNMPCWHRIILSSKTLSINRYKKSSLPSPYCLKAWHKYVKVSTTLLERTEVNHQRQLQTLISSQIAPGKPTLQTFLTSAYLSFPTYLPSHDCHPKLNPFCCYFSKNFLFFCSV